jgi:hypothetical protein
MSRACKDTRRSSGGLHVVSDARNSPDGEQTDCACAEDQSRNGAAMKRIFVRRPGSVELFAERSSLVPNARRVRPMESSDVPLALDARAE